MLDKSWLARRALTTAWGSQLLIFTVCNGPYSPVASTWHKSVERVGLARHAVIFAADATAACVLAANDLDDHTYILGSRLPPVSVGRAVRNTSIAWSISSTWRCNTSLPALRFRVLAAISPMGFDLLYSDADMQWLASPLGALARIVAAASQQTGSSVAYGLATSRGSYPLDLSKRWGATACTGVIFTYGTLPPAFWARLSRYGKYGSRSVYDSRENDQYNFNHMLADLRVQWPEKPLLYRDSNSTTTSLLCLPSGHVNAFGVAVRRQGPCSSPLSFTLLSFTEFPRVECEQSWPPETILLHCVSSTYKANAKHIDSNVKRNGEATCKREASIIDHNQSCSYEPHRAG